MRDLSAQFLALAEKHGATGPLLIAHRIMGISLATTGDIATGRAHFDRALALYDPAEHRALATRFSVDAAMSILSYRSWTIWVLGYPEAALADADNAIKIARDIGQASTLMYALDLTAYTLIHCGNYAAASMQTNELAELADEKGSPFWLAFGGMNRGCLSALTGKPSDGVQMLTIGIDAHRSTGARHFLPWYLSILSYAYSELGQFDDAWRCIGEAMTAVETTKERWCEAEVHRMAGETHAACARAGCRGGGNVFRARARRCASAASKVLGTTRGDEHGPALAGSGQAAASARIACSSLRLVHRRIRHPRSQSGKVAARRVSIVIEFVIENGWNVSVWHSADFARCPLLVRS